MSFHYPIIMLQCISIHSAQFRSSYATNIGKATHIWICPHPTQVGPTLRVVLLLLVEISHKHASFLSGSRIAHQDLENSVNEVGMLIDIVQRYIWYVRIFRGRADGPSQDPKKGFVSHSFQNVPENVLTCQIKCAFTGPSKCSTALRFILDNF